MDTSEFAVRLILLFFPGVVCAYIVDTLTVHPPRRQFMFVLNAFILGLASYCLYWAVLRSSWAVLRRMRVVDGDSSALTFLPALSNPEITISYSEVAFVTATAVVLGLCVTAASTYKVHFRLARWLGLTKKFGELDVWGFVFNSPDYEWATVRDHRHGLMYDGWVQLFSDDAENYEVLLRDVKVFDNASGKELYAVDSLYLSLERGDITIELREASTEDDQNG